VRTGDLPTPALVVDAGILEQNLAEMAATLPGPRLRPHVKAHKSTGLARRQAAHGHSAFTCATIRECEGMAAAGLGADLLLANEVLDGRRLDPLVEAGHRVTLAVDSSETVAAAAASAVEEVVIDVNVGLNRCGCEPPDAARIAELARSSGLWVRGVMGYEGHAVALEDAARRQHECREAMKLLWGAHEAVGGELMSAGGTGTFDLNTWASEVQAGSYALMDSAYGRLGLPFRQAVFVLTTVISASAARGYAVLDAGLKAFGMDKGYPSVPDSKVRSCADEHLIVSPARLVGERLLVTPAHVDPTVAYHDRMYVVEGDDVIEEWPVDLRGW
jgi:D-serine deaminase-like pyridoxal phosphate-dependent protein